MMAISPDWRAGVPLCNPGCTHKDPLCHRGEACLPVINAALMICGKLVEIRRRGPVGLYEMDRIGDLIGALDDLGVEP